MPTRLGVCNLCEAICGLELTVEGEGSAARVTAVRGNEAWLVVNGGFHSVDLKTGATMELGKIDGANVRDIAILPAM